MGRLIEFGVGLAVFGFLLPIFKNVMDGLTNNTTGILASNNLTSFERVYWDMIPIIVPVFMLATLLIALGRRRPREGAQ